MSSDLIKLRSQFGRGRGPFFCASDFHLDSSCAMKSMIHDVDQKVLPSLLLSLDIVN